MDTKRHTYRLVGMFTSLIYLAIIHTGFAVGARTSSAQWSNACTGVRINATPIPAVGIIDQFDGFVFDGSGRYE